LRGEGRERVKIKDDAHRHSHSRAPSVIPVQAGIQNFVPPVLFTLSLEVPKGPAGPKGLKERARERVN